MDSNVRLAKVDATASPKLTGKYNIESFPTIKYFNNGKDSDYTGGRTTDAIVSWAQKKSTGTVKTISTMDDLDVLIAGNDISLLGVFSSEDSTNARVFLSWAYEGSGGVEDIAVVAMTASTEVRDALHLQDQDTVVIHKNFDAPRVDLSVEQGFDAKVVEAFVLSHSSPLVQEFSQHTAKKIFSNPIKKHALLFTAEEKEEREGVSLSAGFHHLAAVKEVSPLFKNEVLFIHVTANEDTQRVLDYFGLLTADLPVIIFADMTTSATSSKKFHYFGDYSLSSLTDFTKDFLGGKLTPYLKSQAPSASDMLGDVMVVTGKSFQELVVNNEKDVLMEFYAPW